MSYILDALKKAEAERKLGTVPTIHAQPLTGAVSSVGTSLWRRPLLWAGLVLTAIVLIGLIVLMWFRSANTVDIVPKPVPVQAAPVPSPPVASPPVVAPPLAAEPAPVPVKPRRSKESAATMAPPAQKKPAPAVTKSAEEKPLPRLSELPEQIQREIPQLTIGGYIYSPTKADRFILINKKLLHEGDQVAPDLVLEKMLPDGLIFSYKGYRYRRSY